MSTIDPDPARLPELLASLPAGVPIFMLNLLRFRAEAQYRDGTPGGSGREAYARYAELTKERLAQVGAEILYFGNARAMIIAPPAEKWDAVLLVRYPSAEAFARMLAMPDYLAGTIHRTAALEDARLIATISAR